MKYFERLKIDSLFMKWTSICIAAVAACLLNTACNNEQKEMKTEQPAAEKGIVTLPFGMVDSQEVKLFRLTNAAGTVVKITNYGGIITEFTTKDRIGNRSSIVVGFDSLAPYLQGPPYFGALIGRYGNRIGNGKFSLNGQTYTLAKNNGANHLHGGVKGFDKVVWTPQVLEDSVPRLKLSYLSKDGEEGYPGNLQVTVTYTLNDDDGLSIRYEATTDKATPVNLTNHSYFNLTGNTDSTILKHLLQVNATAYTPVDDGLIPTGELRPVQGTPFDFSNATPIGSRIDSVPGGYDHNFVLTSQNGTMQRAASLVDTVSGRFLEVWTTEPGMQFYTGNFLDGKFTNHTGAPVKFRTALCLETQHFPDSPNKPKFPSTILEPGKKYFSETIYKTGTLQTTE